MSYNKISVHQYSADGKFLRTFPSITVAAGKVRSCRSNISVAIKYFNQCKGYYWKTGNKTLSLSVRKYRRGGKHIKIYLPDTHVPIIAETISEACAILHVPHSTLRNWARRNIEHPKYGWRCHFVDSRDKYNKLHEFDLYKRKYPPLTFNKKVPIVTTDASGNQREFSSIIEAARELHINEKSICSVLAGRWSKAGGYQIRKLTNQ